MTPDDNNSEREARVTQLLQTAAQTERAPASLRAEVDALRARADTRRGRHGARALALPGLAARYASIATTAVAAVVVALVLALGSGGGLSIAQAASLAARGPAAPAPAPDPQAPHALLSARVGDLHFPNWHGWRTVGERTDKVGGRTVKTVYYERAGRRLAYSIVSSPTLSGMKTHGERYETIPQPGRNVVVWRARNHTCIVSAAGLSPRKLWRLASSTPA